MNYTNTLILSLLIVATQIKAVFQVISQPGLYQLGESVTYSPAGPNDVIFQITASNVEFDLGDRFIAQDGANVQTGLIGIQVASGLSNVTIKSGDNGSIQNIRGTGIQVLSNCSRISLDNITTSSCDDRGIDFVGSNGNEIVNSEIKNCKILRCSQNTPATAAMSLVFCDNLTVVGVNLDNNGPADSLSCIALDNSDRCNFDTITMRGNAPASIWNGLFLNTVTDSTFKNVLCESNSSDLTSFAYLLIGCSGIVFFNCTALGTTSPEVNDFRLETCTNVLMDNCLVEQINATDGIGFFDFGNSGVTFINCIARNNTAVTGMQGFSAENSSNSTFVSCLASDQIASAGFAIGFSINSTTNPFMQDCIATRNIGTPVAGNSFGISAGANTNQVFVHNVASRNGTVAADQFSGVAAGAVNNVLATAVNSTAIGPWTNLGLT